MSSDEKKPAVPDKYLPLQQRPNVHKDDIAEERITKELTSNPFKQYSGSTRITPDSPYQTPIEEFQNTIHLTGSAPDAESRDHRLAITSSRVRAADVDAIPPTSLFLGRIGQKKSPQLERLIESTRSQRDFFLKVGYSDEVLKHTVIPTAMFAALTMIVATPFERARSIVQADFASLASLQDNGINMAEKIARMKAEVQEAEEIAKAEKQATKTATQESLDATSASKSAKSQPTESKKKTPSSSELRKQAKKQAKSSFPPFIQPERRDPLVPWFKAHPNSTRAPILKPTAYDIYARRQVLLFEDEFQKNSTAPEYRMMSGYDRALAVKKQGGARFENIAITPYSAFNHQLEHAGHAERASEIELVNQKSIYGKAKGNDLSSLLNRYYSRFGLTKPLESELVPQNQSDLFRGFHRFYNEPRYNSTTAVFRMLYQTQGLRGFFTLTSLAALTCVIPILTVASFYKPWKVWITEVNDKSTIFGAELLLAGNHARSGLISLLATYPLYAIFTRTAVNKSLLYPAYNTKVDPEMTSWKERFTEFHLQTNTLSKYSSKPPPNPLDESRPPGLYPDQVSKYPETGENSPAMKKYQEKKQAFVNTLLKREEKKPRIRAVLGQLFHHEGMTFMGRGWLPTLCGVLAYFTVFSITYAIAASETVYKMDDLRQDLRPAPPPGHQHDLNLETIKAVVPFSIATLFAQYAAYPLTTIRSYVCAADSAGYVTFNKLANPLPLPISVDQYRLPLRHVEPVSAHQQLKIAVHEIRRQAGWKGFYRGALIIPFLRIPQSIALGACCFYTMNRVWPKSHEIIDMQHFYNFVPQIL